jgi:valyl-tRNA synthetase
MGRNFANKLWNASRFAIMNLDTPEGVPETVADEDLAFEDRWILSRLNRTVRSVTTSLAEYRMNDAAHSLYSFVWREFCDWYLEIVKPRLYADGEHQGAARHTLATVLETTLRLLHPMIPFVTEEIREHLSEVLGREWESISYLPWPECDAARIDDAVDAEMETMIALTRAVRNIRAEMNVPEGARLSARVSVKDEAARDLVNGHAARFGHLARLDSLDAEIDLAKPEGSYYHVVGEMEVYLPLGDVIDLEAELKRLAKEETKLENQARASERKLSNREFLEKAPAEVVERERERRDEIANRLLAIQSHIRSLESLQK